MSVPGATIRAMPGDLERLPAGAAAAAPGAGPAPLAPEQLDELGALVVDVTTGRVEVERQHPAR